MVGNNAKVSIFCIRLLSKGRTAEMVTDGPALFIFAQCWLVAKSFRRALCCVGKRSCHRTETSASVCVYRGLAVQGGSGGSGGGRRDITFHWDTQNDTGVFSSLSQRVHTFETNVPQDLYLLGERVSYFLKIHLFMGEKCKICSVNVKHIGRRRGKAWGQGEDFRGIYCAPISHGLHCLALYYKRGGRTVIE